MEAAAFEGVSIVGSTNRKGTRAARARNRKATTRSVEHIERFKGAPPEVRQGEYIRRAQMLMSFGENALKVFTNKEPSDPLWAAMAKKIDDATNVIRPRGEIPAARMALLQCVDEAVHYRTRFEPIRHHVPAFERMLLAKTDADLSPEDRAAVREILTTCPAYWDGRRIDEAGRGPVIGLPPWQFAAFLMPLRCAPFAWELRTPEALAALEATTTAWTRGPADHGSTATGPRKWEAANALMQTVGLVGTTEESLQSEWRAYQRDREGKQAKR